VFVRTPTRKIPAVNVGSRQNPVWYAQEFLRIAHYQPYTRPVPDSYAASMVDQACRDPRVSRAYIEREDLGSIGFTIGAGTTAFVSPVDFPFTYVI
jgi:eukaryotic translation initiation factor 2C